MAFFIRYSYIIQHIKEWYLSPVTNPSDPSLAAYEVCSISFRFVMKTGIARDSLMDLRVPLRLQVNYLLIMWTFVMQIVAWTNQWIDHRP